MLLEIPSLGPIAAPSGIVEYGITALQIGAIATSFSHESSQPTLYSKFAAAKDGELENPIPTRNGMIRIYAPSAIVAALFMAAPFTQSTLAAPLLFVHFSKRLLEVLAVHNYSGSMPATQANFIGTYYALVTLLVASLALPLDQVDPDIQKIGLALFCVGTLGNFYHHFLLASLRSDKSASSSKRYVPPQGGLFSLVAAPHYLFETIAWLGIAFAAQQTNAFLVCFSMASYLAGRATATNAYYMEKFTEEEWPRSRKAIVPGIL